MKKISLSQNKHALINDEDYKKLSRYNWYFHRGRAVRHPSKSNGKRKGFVWMHREIMNPKDDEEVDHINGNPLDNRKKNLRICTHSQNQWNQKLNKRSTTGVKNIQWSNPRQRYLVRARKHGKLYHFGQFKSLDEAIKVRNDKVVKLHEGFNDKV